jgi:hypothetical protein
MEYKLPTPLLFFLLCLTTLMLLGLINLIGPSDLGAGGIFVVLMLIYAVFFLFFMLVARAIKASTGSFRKKNVENTTKIMRARRRSVLISAVLAFAPLLLVSMNSLGQMQLWYIALVALFETAAVFFVIKKV